MDPQKLSQLDPKLRDAYQRVMGTVIPEPVQTQTPPPVDGPTTPLSDPTQAPQPQPQPIPEPQPEAIPTPPTQPEPFFRPQPATPASNFVQMNSEVSAPAAAPTISSPNFATPLAMPQDQPVTIKKRSGMMPVLFGIVAIIFIVIYTLFWTKIFNFKLPFLP